jgi:hypothetical protein
MPNKNITLNKTINKRAVIKQKKEINPSSLVNCKEKKLVVEFAENNSTMTNYLW